MCHARDKSTAIANRYSNASFVTLSVNVRKFSGKIVNSIFKEHFLSTTHNNVWTIDVSFRLLMIHEGRILSSDFVVVFVVISLDTHIISRCLIAEKSVIFCCALMSCSLAVTILYIKTRTPKNTYFFDMAGC